MSFNSSTPSVSTLMSNIRGVFDGNIVNGVMKHKEHIKSHQLLLIAFILLLTNKYVDFRFNISNFSSALLRVSPTVAI